VCVCVCAHPYPERVARFQSCYFGRDQKWHLKKKEGREKSGLNHCIVLERILNCMQGLFTIYTIRQKSD